MSNLTTSTKRLRTSTFEALVFKATARLLQGMPDERLLRELAQDGRIQYELGRTTPEDPVLGTILEKAKASL